MIRLERVSKTWGDFAVRDVDITVAFGEYLVVVGPTGAGKTLLLELLLGIHRPDAGRIAIDGRDVTDLPPERRGIGMVYQDYVLFPHLDVAANLAFGLRYQRLDARERQQRVAEVAAQLRIEHLLHRRPNTLSGGEQQRTAIGRALVTRPSILLLDEPFSALDRGTTARLREEIRALHQKGGLTILHVTHDLVDARETDGRIALVHDGRVHGIGSADELMRRPQTRFTAEFFGAENLLPAKLVVAGGGEPHFAAGPLVAPSPPPPPGVPSMPCLLVHADEVAVLDALPSVPVANVVRGEVCALREHGPLIAVQLRIDGLSAPLHVHLARETARARALQLGSSLVLDLRHAVHPFHD